MATRNDKLTDILRLFNCRYRANSTAGQFDEDRSESGASLVEFTVLMPVFFLIVFGIIEFGLIFFDQNNMINAAREAARAVAVQASTVSSAQQFACTNYLQGTGPTYTITVTDQCPSAQDVKVAISVGTAQAAFFNYLGKLTGTLNASVIMRKEATCQATGAGSTVSSTCH